MIRSYLLVIALLFASFPAYADYRPNHGGFAHSHDCVGSELENCEPHHHTLDDFGIKIAVDKMIHLALLEYNRKMALRGKLGRENYWSMRKSLVEAFIEYFKENRKELLEAIPSNLGNAPLSCQFSPPNNMYDLTHSVEECSAFEAGKPLPPRNAHKERVSRPKIES